MKLLPGDSFVIESPEPAAELARRLAEHVEPPAWSWRWSWWYAQPHQPFMGSVAATGFEIRPFIRYRNSFLPILRGRFEEREGGTTVRVDMRLHLVVRGFMAMWFCVGGAITAFLLVAVVSAGWRGLLGLACPLGLVLFGWALAHFGFQVEAGPARRKLEGILGASGGPPPGTAPSECA